MDQQKAKRQGHQCPPKNANSARVLTNLFLDQACCEVRLSFAATVVGARATNAGSKTSAMNRLRFKLASMAALSSFMCRRLNGKKSWPGSKTTKRFANFLTRLGCSTWTASKRANRRSRHSLSASYISREALETERPIRIFFGRPQSSSLPHWPCRSQRIFDAANALREPACL